MGVEKSLLRVVPAIQAAHLVKANTGKKKKGLPKMAVNNIVGTSFIKLQSDLIESL